MDTIKLVNTLVLLVAFNFFCELCNAALTNFDLLKVSGTGGLEQAHVRTVT